MRPEFVLVMNFIFSILKRVGGKLEMCKLELYLFYNGMKSLGEAAPF